MTDLPTHNDGPDDPDWGLMLGKDKISFAKLGADTVKEALELLESRYRIEFDRFQNLEVKGAALFSGIVVLLTVVPRNPIEHILSLLLFWPLYELGKMLTPKRYGFSPNPDSVLKGLLAAADVEDQNKQISRAFRGSVETYKKAIDFNFEQNEKKAKFIDKALKLMAGWALIWVLWQVAAPFVPQFDTTQLPVHVTSSSTLPRSSGRPAKLTAQSSSERRQSLPKAGASPKALPP